MTCPATSLIRQSALLIGNLPHAPSNPGALLITADEARRIQHELDETAAWVERLIDATPAVARDCPCADCLELDEALSSVRGGP